jgi:tight adherence protein B
MTEHIGQVAGLLAGLAVLLAFAGYALNLERSRLDARLLEFVGTGAAVTRPRTTPSIRKRGLPYSHLLGRLRLGIRPGQLAQAGVSMTPARFAWLQVGACLAGLAVGRLIALRLGLGGPLQLLVVIGIGAAGLAVPLAVLHVQRRRRLAQFEQQFASALDSMANSLEVGLSLPQSLEMLSRDMPAPVGPEFGTVVREMGMGLGFGEALDHLAERVPLKDVQIFAAAVQIQHRTGGHLSGVLHTIASTVRERVNLRGEIRTLTAQQRISAYIVGALPLFLALVLKFVSPAYFERLLEPGMMRLLLVLAGMGIVAGFYFMLRVADIEV